MQDAVEKQAVAAVARASGEFFIPDLCAPRSVFFLVLLSELDGVAVRPQVSRRHVAEVKSRLL